MTDANVLFSAVQNAIAKSKWKESSQNALLHILDRVFYLSRVLNDQTYKSTIQSTFIIDERGRKRLIDSFGVDDRAVRHALCDNVFSPMIRNKIIYDNGASIKGRGISFARKRFEAHLRKYYMQHGTNKGYILFGDYSKYYDNVIHSVAKDQLLKLVDYDPYISWLLDEIFKAFEVDVTSLPEDIIDRFKSGVLNKLELYSLKNELVNDTDDLFPQTLEKSISIGDLLSQTIGVYYPHEIDNYIKIVKSQKYYGRYMDDWYIMSDSKDELRLLLNDIVVKANEIGLQVNLKKTHIVRMDYTYKYLQIKYSLTDTGKIIKRINPQRVTKMRKRLKKLKRKVDEGTVEYSNVENMFKGWMGSFYKLLSKEQRNKLIELFSSLYNKQIYIIRGKMYIE